MSATPNPPGRPPVPVAGLVRRAMHEFVRTAGTRRALPPVLHVGLPDDRPGSLVAELSDRPWYDAGLRADLVSRALEGLAIRAPGPLAWISRSGGLAATDADLAWLAACRHAFARHGLELDGFYLVTRAGWADLIGGNRHPWSRVRPNRLASRSDDR